MPFFLLFVGTGLVWAGVKDTQGQLFTLLKGDLWGAHSFLPWVIVLYVIAMAGNIKAIKPVTDAFLVLVIVVLFLSNKGFFSQFQSQTGI